MENFYEKKAIKNGAVRNCKKCKSDLSSYKTENICSSCQKVNYRKTKDLLSEIINEIS
jgi:methylphosphotriester-DNA--protein-cysteine methyltransferase